MPAYIVKMVSHLCRPKCQQIFRKRKTCQRFESIKNRVNKLIEYKFIRLISVNKLSVTEIVIGFNVIIFEQVSSSNYNRIYNNRLLFTHFSYGSNDIQFQAYDINP